MPTPKRPSKLSKTYVKKIATPGRYGDGRGGHGLSLRVRRTANGRLSKTWSQRIRINGRPTNLGLGSYPVITLAMAREKAIDNRRRMAQGEDILAAPVPLPTAGEFLQQEADARARRRRGRNAGSEPYRMLSHCKPIADKPVSEVTPADVLSIIDPLWTEKNSTARDVRSFISAAMRRAVTLGHRAADPAGPEIARLLGRAQPEVHHESLPHGQLGAALATVRDSDLWWSEKCAILFLAITAVRSGDVRGATWDQIDLESEFPVWHIPRTKNDQAHGVPLSTQAVEILLYAEERTGGRGRVFPAQKAAGPMSSGRLSKPLKKLGIKTAAHGFRSSFRNWAGRRADIAQPAAEVALEHAQPPVVRAYLTDDFFEERISLMQEWADYLGETMGPVISDQRS